MRHLSNVGPQVAQSGWQGKQVLIEGGEVMFEGFTEDVIGRRRKKPAGQVGPGMQVPFRVILVVMAQTVQNVGELQEVQEGSQAVKSISLCKLLVLVEKRTDTALSICTRSTSRRTAR